MSAGHDFSLELKYIFSIYHNSMQECDDGREPSKPGLRECQEPVGRIIGDWDGMSSTGPTKSNHHSGERRRDEFPVRFRGPWVRAGELPELFRSWDLAYR